MSQIRIAIADDHSLFRSGLARVLDLEPDLVVRIVAANGEELLEKLSRQKADVVLMDIAMPTIDGIETTRLIRQSYKDVKVIGVTMHGMRYYVNRMMEAGANGFILKSAELDELCEGIKRVHSGKSYFCSDTMELMVPSALRKDSKSIHPFGLLSDREVEMIRLLMNDKTDAEIAEALHLGIRSISNQKKELFEKLGIKNPIGLVKMVMDTSFPLDIR